MLVILGAFTKFRNFFFDLYLIRLKKKTAMNTMLIGNDLSEAILVFYKV